jgi:glycosyltransferase involved in cell wall biosynthesis
MPWRNAPRLLVAAARLEVGLLFVGRDIWGTDPTARLAAERGWDWARFTGYVDDDALPELYSAARVFAYPSLYEGFGIPPLEAMACGTPVVASTRGALPEVLGDAALLVDPRDTDALAQALEAALGDSGDLRRRGLERAARFDWATTAEQTWQVYRATAAAR